MSTIIRSKVFISYSHRDKRFLDELLDHLKPLERAGLVSKWSDRDIVAGSQWFDTIKAALAITKVAVLLVSRSFLASDFIHDHELGPLLKEGEEGGVRILWVPLGPCNWKETSLEKYQAAVSPEASLSLMEEAARDRAWVTVCVAIKEALNPNPR